MSLNSLANSGLESRRKRLGAFYTDRKVASFLVEWAVREKTDKIFDPSFGGGVFLEAAAERLTLDGGNPARQIFGVEIDPSVHEAVEERLRLQFGIDSKSLIRSDFFGVHPEFIPKMSAVVGNPPFIRFHRFTGASREHAQQRVSESGVILSELSSSWAAFVVHSTAFLREGGRLAMVVPYEICQATYAQPVLRHLGSCFAEVTILTFKEKLFPELNENTALLLADGYRPRQDAKFFWNDFQNADSLAEHLSTLATQSSRISLDTEQLVSGGQRFTENLVAPRARELYKRLTSGKQMMRLGEIANVGIGYVTGANDYFHLSAGEAQRRLIPQSFLRRAVRRGRSIPHPYLTEADWNAGTETEECGYLLYIPPESQLPLGIEAYLREGIRIGIPDRYKCRNRTPWFTVPHVYTPDALLSYMSGRRARMSANLAKAVAPNSLHVVKFHLTCGYSASAVAALWQTSLTRLSTEIEGHALGGGMLKLEPREAEAVAVAWPAVSASRLDEIAEELDTLSRTLDQADVQRRADELILQKELRMTAHECSELYNAAEMLTLRRTFKLKANASD